MHCVAVVDSGVCNCEIDGPRRVPYGQRMHPRPLSLLFAALVLACTPTDDSSSATSSGSTAMNGTGGSGSTTATTGAVDPTTGAIDPTTGAAEVGESGSTTGVGAVSFTDVYEQIIVPKACNSGYCHGGGAGGLEMTDEATTYANLVEVGASTMVCDQSMRVVPGSLEESILWSRVRPAALDGGMPCAPKMPQGSMGLSDSEAKLVSDWISGGALE